MGDILIIKEVEYAISILDELSKNDIMSAVELSEKRDIPSPFIYRVLKKLELAEIIEIKRGAHGGCRLKRSCSDMTLYDVICAFENTFLIIECLKPGYDCSQNQKLDCRLHREYGQIQKLLSEEFQRKTLDELFSE